MTTQERDQLARDIYEALTLHAGYYAAPWSTLKDCDKLRYQRAADRANARHRQMGYGREAGRRAVA